MLPHVKINGVVHVAGSSRVGRVGSTRCFVGFRTCVDFGPNNIYHGTPHGVRVEEPAQCLECLASFRHGG